MSTPNFKAKVTQDHQMLALACARRFHPVDLIQSELMEVYQIFAEYEAAVRADMFVDAAQSFSGAIGPAPKAVEQFLLSL